MRDAPKDVVTVPDAASMPAAEDRIDGRHRRSIKTRQRIIESYLELAQEMSPYIPTAAQIAERAGYSTRSLFERFPDIHSLQVAAADFGITLIAEPPPPRHGDSRLARIEAQVRSRSTACEQWLPLWRSLVANQGASPELRERIALLRRRVMERLEAVYQPELATLPEISRRRLLITLDAVTDIESWGRMKEYFGLSPEEAREAWVKTIDRLLPPTPSNS
ncbi:MAG: TetR/AcrR family transcriptional regulator [Reyranellaceae bacterium]